MRVEDFDILHEKIFSNTKVVENTFGSSGFSKEETKEFLKNKGNFDKNTGLSVLIEKEKQSIIGLAGILSCDYLDEQDYEIGFILEENSWGKGYAKEIGLEQIEQIKGLGQKRAIAAAAKDNLSSHKALSSLGFKLEKTAYDEIRGERVIYSLKF